MKRLIIVGLVLGGLALLTGCTANTEPIERTAEKGFNTVDKFVDKATSELKTRSASVHGTLTAINPAWRLKGNAGWFTGAMWDISLGVEGGSGTMTLATQADQGPDLAAGPEKSPAKTEPTTKPSE